MGIQRQFPSTDQPEHWRINAALALCVVALLIGTFVVVNSNKEITAPVANPSVPTADMPIVRQGDSFAGVPTTSETCNYLTDGGSVDNFITEFGGSTSTGQDDAGAYLALTVMGYCDEHVPLLNDYVSRTGG